MIEVQMCVKNMHSTAQRYINYSFQHVLVISFVINDCISRYHYNRMDIILDAPHDPRQASKDPPDPQHMVQLIILIYLQSLAKSDQQQCR